MNRFALWLANWLARFLAPEDHDALLGDQKELGLSGFQAAREAVGLIVRRQYQLSTADESGLGPWWRIAPVFYILISQSVEVSRSLDRASDAGAVFFCACWGAIILALSWTTGFLLGSFSGRAHRVNSALLAAFWLVYLGYSSARYDLSTATLTLHGLLFGLPVVVGFRSGVMRKSLSTFKSVLIAAVPPVMLVGFVFLVTRGQASGGSLLTWVALAFFLVFTFAMAALPGVLLVFLSLVPRRCEAVSRPSEAAS